MIIFIFTAKILSCAVFLHTLTQQQSILGTSNLQLLSCISHVFLDRTHTLQENFKDVLINFLPRMIELCGALQLSPTNSSNRQSSAPARTRQLVALIHRQSPWGDHNHKVRQLLAATFGVTCFAKFHLQCGQWKWFLSRNLCEDFKNFFYLQLFSYSLHPIQILLTNAVSANGRAISTIRWLEGNWRCEERSIYSGAACAGLSGSRAHPWNIPLCGGCNDK